ncbi:SDR family NAD(P)-dependent oxidoreductase [Planctomycetota bacterium]|nr:SDR family NAD(P)-dependent oxidoreductase [Planctomycetota bacterium]
MKLENKTILITGANKGLGLALTQQLLTHNIKKIYATSRNLDNLNDITHPNITKLQLDITDPNQITQAASIAADTQILINNAGIITYEDAFEADLQSIHQNFNTNFFSNLNMIRAFTPILKQNTPAAIINIASIAAFANFPFIAGYSASKAALFSLTQSTRIHLATSNIAVHSVNPGPIDTDMTKNLDMPKTSPTDVANNIIDALIQDQPDIFPDPTSQHFFSLWNNNYRDLEQAVQEMTTTQPTTN